MLPDESLIVGPGSRHNSPIGRPTSLSARIAPPPANFAVCGLSGQAFPRPDLGLAHHDVQRRSVAHGVAAAVVVASRILEQRGNSPRQFRVMLVFVASDAEAMEGPDLEVHHYLAWKSIVEEQEILNLDAHHRRQAQDSMTRSNETVDLRLREAYSWLLVPAQEADAGAG
jgi:hypothetical protein